MIVLTMCLQWSQARVSVFIMNRLSIFHKAHFWSKSSNSSDFPISPSLRKPKVFVSSSHLRLMRWHLVFTSFGRELFMFTYID